MGKLNIWYKSKKTLQNEGLGVLAHKGRRYIREQVERCYYLKMRGVRDNDGLDDNYYYFGHPKCATNWIRAFLYQLCLRQGINYRIIGGDASRAFTSLRSSSTFNLHVNSQPNVLRNLEGEGKGFRMVRDPRDLLVSAYFSWKKSHYHISDRQMKQREMLENSSMEEGLLMLMQDFDSFKTMAGWNMDKYPGVLLVRYEDLLKDELGGFREIVDHLGLAIDDQMQKTCVEKSSFKTMAGKRKKGQENRASHYRKGAAGDWENYMPRDSDLYRRFIELHGPLMRELGYE